MAGSREAGSGPMAALISCLADSVFPEPALLFLNIIIKNALAMTTQSTNKIISDFFYRFFKN